MCGLTRIIGLLLVWREAVVVAFSVEPRRRSGAVANMNSQNNKLWSPAAAEAKLELLKLLRDGNENICASSLLDSPLATLASAFQESQVDARTSLVPTINGVWREVKPPSFPGRQGFNYRGKPLYSITRLTGGMIKSVLQLGGPILCAVEWMSQDVHFVKDAAALVTKGLLPIPVTLRQRVEAFPNLLQTFFLDTHFSIEEYNIRGVFRMEGYFFPHAVEQNRLETWFTGGRCLAYVAQNPDSWSKVFGTQLPSLKSAPKRSSTKIVSPSAPLLYHEEDLIDDPALAYTFQEPWMGHQRVMYLDDDLRVTVGHLGTRVVNIRMDD